MSEADKAMYVVDQRQHDLNTVAEVQRRIWQTSEDHGFHEAQLNIHPGAVTVILYALWIHRQISNIVGDMRDVRPQEADEGAYMDLVERLANVVSEVDVDMIDTTPEQQSILSKLVLLHEEVTEAFECVMEEIANPDPLGADFLDGLARVKVNPEKPGKPEGFGSEIWDVIIRSFDALESTAISPDVGFDKMDYNDGRPHLHGRNL